MPAQMGDQVHVHYKGTLNNGSVFDSSEGKAPLKFHLGAGEMIPGFEQAVIDMEVDQSKTVTIPAAEAYGPARDDLLVSFEVGDRFQLAHPSGKSIPVRIKSIQDQTVVLDANHDLAGQDLTFDLTLVSIHTPEDAHDRS